MIQEQEYNSLWKQFEIKVDLYKHHLELLLKFTAYHYAITGAILSFYFSRPDLRIAVYSLVFPIVVSFFSGLMCLYAGRFFEYDMERIEPVRETLGIIAVRELIFLPIALKLSGGLLVFTSIGLFALLFSVIT